MRWPSLEGQVIDRLRRTDCLRLDVVRRGKAPEWRDNPIALAITIPESSSQDWTLVSDELVAILDEAQLFEVIVEIARGVLWPAFFDGPGVFLPLDMGTPPARGGASLGLRGISGMKSTLGGLIEILMPEEDNWECYGITCHHAVVPDTASNVMGKLDVSDSSKYAVLSHYRSDELSGKALHEWNAKGI